MDKTQGTEATKVKTYRGGCHCGAVRFEAELDLTAGATRCNCSICTKIAQASSHVAPEAFRLLSDPAAMSMYEWGGKIARRYFCKTCGVHAFARGHLAELGGDYVSVNYNCLDEVDPATLKIGYWDGRHNNWYAGTRPAPWPVFT
jgi:hypothetical protein